MSYAVHQLTWFVSYQEINNFEPSKDIKFRLLPAAQ